MAWSASKAFTAFITDNLNLTAPFNVSADLLRAALYNNTITPDQTVSSANTAYGAGIWTGAEVADVSGWPAGGRQLLSVTSTSSGNVYTLDAADTVSATSNTTLANVYGTLIYDDTLTTPVANQGVGFIYFGSAANVTAGTFTIQWNTAGLLQITL